MTDIAQLPVPERQRFSIAESSPACYMHAASMQLACIAVYGLPIYYMHARSMQFFARCNARKHKKRIFWLS